MHRAQSWQDNLFLWVQSGLECHSYDLRRERKEHKLSKGRISGSLCRQGSNRLQRESCLRREDRPWRRTGGIASMIILPSTFGGPANPNISDTSLNRRKKKREKKRRKKKHEIAGRPACKRNLRIPGKGLKTRGFMCYPKVSRELSVCDSIKTKNKTTPQNCVLV